MSDNHSSDESSQAQWEAWLSGFKRRFIAAQEWDERTANRRIKDAWAVVREGSVAVLSDSESERPADAVPVFLLLGPGGWKVPIQIVDALTGLIGKALASDRSPRDILLGLLSLDSHSDAADESAEIRQKRNSAAFWGCQLLDACEDKSLAEAVKIDGFWQAALAAFQAGYRHAILALSRDRRLLADLVRAQAFAAGRSPDELTRRLALERERQLQATGREPKPRALAKGIGGKWNALDGWWEFPFDDLQTPSHKALCRRIEAIRRSHKGGQ